MQYCQQCAKENGGPAIERELHHTTMAQKGMCDACGYVWMDRAGNCVDANCPIGHEQNTPRPVSIGSQGKLHPMGTLRRVGPQAAGRFLSTPNK